MLNAKNLIWDVDGTLYIWPIEVRKKMMQKIHEKFSEELGVPLSEGSEIFEREWKSLGIGTEIFKKYGIEPILLLEAMNSVSKEGFLKKDPKLIETFRRITNFNHFILTNNTKQSILDTLKIIGIPKDIFTLIVSYDNVTNIKPNPEPFIKILEFTKDPPETHVAIGDNEEMDIIPPKKLGMKTIMVGKISEIADVSVGTVYDVPRVLVRSY